MEHKLISPGIFKNTMDSLQKVFKSNVLFLQRKINVPLRN